MKSKLHILLEVFLMTGKSEVSNVQFVKNLTLQSLYTHEFHQWGAHVHHCKQTLHFLKEQLE